MRQRVIVSGVYQPTSVLSPCNAQLPGKKPIRFLLKAGLRKGATAITAGHLINDLSSHKVVNSPVFPR